MLRPAGADHRQLLPEAGLAGGLFPFIFLAYMAVGAAWLFVVHRRQPGTLAGIQADLARAPELIEEESIEIGEVAPQPVMA